MLNGCGCFYFEVFYQVHCFTTATHKGVRKVQYPSRNGGRKQHFLYFAGAILVDELQDLLYILLEAQF